MRVSKTKTSGEWNHGRVERMENDCFFAPSDVKRKSPLVEWARGKGLIVLPHPPLLNNNYSQLIDSRILNGWPTHGNSQ